MGPFIAKVALAAGECGTVDFPVHGQGALLCPAGSSGGEVSFWSIIAKVEFAALCWGAGTAIGMLFDHELTMQVNFHHILLLEVHV